jgi:hypothetical protein
MPRGNQEEQGEGQNVDQEGFCLYHRHSLECKHPEARVHGEGRGNDEHHDIADRDCHDGDADRFDPLVGKMRLAPENKL